METSRRVEPIRPHFSLRVGPSREGDFERYDRNELDGKIEWRVATCRRRLPTAARRGFQTLSQSQELIVRHYLLDTVRGIMKNVVLFATSRKPDVDGIAEIRSIMKDQAPNGYPMQDSVKALVRSRAFLEYQVMSKAKQCRTGLACPQGGRAARPVASVAGCECVAIATAVSYIAMRMDILAHSTIL